MSLRELHDFELQLVAPCMAMTRRGLGVDDSVRRAMVADLDAALDPLHAELTELVGGHLAASGSKLFVKSRTCKACRNGSKKRLGCAACSGAGKWTWHEFNPASPAQVKIVLYDLLKLPKRTSEGKLTSDEDALKGLLAHDRSGVVERLLRFGKAETMRSIFERLTPDIEGRIHTWYNIGGTETGRFSSSETFLEVSTNLQNLPLKQAARSKLYDVRRCIVPDAGEVFLYADLSQAEARVVAALAGDRGLLERWSDPGFDVHKWTASHIFAKPVGDITPDERYLGKTARHALNYGESWATFQRKVNGDADITGVAIDAATAKSIVAGYHRLHPSLEQWWRRVAAKLDREGWLETVFGRRRTFFGRRDASRWLDGTHREAIAFEPQSTVADLLNRGLLRYWHKAGSQLQAQIHDAVLAGVPIGEAGVWAGRLKAALEEDMVICGTRLRVPCEVEVGYKNWAELDDVPKEVAA